jgi:hypothetical protein
MWGKRRAARSCRARPRAPRPGVQPVRVARRHGPQRDRGAGAARSARPAVHRRRRDGARAGAAQAADQGRADRARRRDPAVPGGGQRRRRSSASRPADLDYPWFIKLANEDASVGITEANVARDAAGLVGRCRELLAEFGEPLLLERYVDGREVNVTLLGSGDDVEVLPLHEIDFAAMPAGRPHIVSYAAKWDEAHVDYAGTKPVPLRSGTRAGRAHRSPPPARPGTRSACATTAGSTCASTPPARRG